MPGWELPVALPSSNIQTCGLKGAAPGCQHAPVHRQSPPCGMGQREQHSSFMHGGICGAVGAQGSSGSPAAPCGPSSCMPVDRRVTPCQHFTLLCLPMLLLFSYTCWFLSPSSLLKTKLSVPISSCSQPVEMPNHSYVF